jgi:imidazolonepropionase-like amidohydrolase
MMSAILQHQLEIPMQQLFKTLILSALAVTLFAGCANQQPAATETVEGFAIQNVTVIDVRTGEKSAGESVLVTGNLIRQVGAAAQVQIPAGMKVVDGQGRFLVPGIWDMHIHAMRAPDRALPLLVARGVSGARDMGADITKVEYTRRAPANGLVAPRLYMAGEGLEGEPGQRPGHPPNTVLDTPEKAREQIQKLAALKVNFLKAHNALQPSVYAAVMDEAKKFNLPVDGHLHPGMDLTTASDAGQRTIEHMNGLQQSCAADPAALRNNKPDAHPIQINKTKCEEVIKHLAEKGTWITPTLGGPGDGNPRTRQYNLALVKMAFDGGIRLLAGTDYNGAGYPVHNYNGTNAYVMDELAGMVEAGLTPVQAMQTATLNPAILIGMDNQLGAIHAGKLADMLLVEGDPTADIANLKRAAAVVVDGKLIEAAEMKKIIDDEMAQREKEKNEPTPAAPNQTSRQ